MLQAVAVRLVFLLAGRLEQGQASTQVVNQAQRIKRERAMINMSLVNVRRHTAQAIMIFTSCGMESLGQWRLLSWRWLGGLRQEAENT